MRKKTFILLLSSTIICLLSCKDEKRTEAEKVVNEWIGKEIAFPSDYQCNIAGKDTTGCEDLLNCEYKILLYIDSLGCTSCKLKLPEWKCLVLK